MHNINFRFRPGLFAKLFGVLIFSLSISFIILSQVQVPINQAGLGTVSGVATAFTAGLNITKYRIVSNQGTSNLIIPHVGVGSGLGISISNAIPGQTANVIQYGIAPCEFDTIPVIGNISGILGDKCHDTGFASLNLISVNLGVSGKIIKARSDLCPLCYDIILIAPSTNGLLSPTTGLITMTLSSCPTGYNEVAALNGKTVIGTLAGNGNVGTTGGNDTITQATHTHSFTQSFNASTPDLVASQTSNPGVAASGVTGLGGGGSFDNRSSFVRVIFCTAN